MNKYSRQFADYSSSNGGKVFSCFSCGGGSTMGYKLAGFEVLGNCEIDEKINTMYVKNHNPKYNYHMDIRNLESIDLPKDLYDLDILDGSPPCSSFSMAGDRGKSWGKVKSFREGQAKQRLDDLFFEYIALAKRLKPKVVVAENVKGLTSGAAKGYVNKIINDFDDAGYDVQIFMLNAAFMDVPQRRERVFFIAGRKDLVLPKIKMEFNCEPISFGSVRSEKGVPLTKSKVYENLLKQRRRTDASIADIYERVHGKRSGMNSKIDSDKRVASTLISGGSHFRMHDGMRLSDNDCIAISTFPVDYDFCGQSVKYVCGMSVPPKMMYHIATQINEQWLRK